jgi:hypothetical protein
MLKGRKRRIGGRRMPVRRRRRDKAPMAPSLLLVTINIIYV